METTFPSPTAVSGETTELHRELMIFLANRSRMFRIARRITGDIGRAEDVVQEAWMRWQRTDRTAVRNPSAFLTTTTTHLAINVVQSARHRREFPTDVPLTGDLDAAEDPTSAVDQAVDVEQTLHHLMARLTPAELAAYVLRKAFDYAYCDIARLLRTSVPNARQLVSRAQQSIEADRVRPVDPAAHRMLVAPFLKAARSGDLTDLEETLVVRKVDRVSSRGLIGTDHGGCGLPSDDGAPDARHRNGSHLVP